MAKKKTTSTPVMQAELINALTDAGYELNGFKRKGDALIVRLTPADLTNDAGGFVALDVCNAADLQARCHVYAETSRKLLIVTVKLPEERNVADEAAADDTESTGTE